MEPSVATSDVVDRLSDKFAVNGVEYVRDFRQKVGEWAVLNAVRAIARNAGADAELTVVARPVVLHQYTASRVAIGGNERGDRPGFSKTFGYPQGGGKSEPKIVDNKNPQNSLGCPGQPRDHFLKEIGLVLDGF